MQLRTCLLTAVALNAATALGVAAMAADYEQTAAAQAEANAKSGVMADLSLTPSAPKLLASPEYRIAQPQACLGQGSWCNETRQCCNDLCCSPDDRLHPGWIGMCTRRFPTSRCIPP
jgi:hypothetical protein